MVVVINLASREEQGKNLAQYAGKLGDGAGEEKAAKLTALVDGGDFLGLMKALSTDIQSVFASGEAAEIEGFFVEILAILASLEDAQKVEVAQLLLAGIVDSAHREQQPMLRLRILSKLYNFFPTSSATRFEIFRSLLEFAKDDTKLAGLVQPSLSTVNDRISEWGVAVEQKRAILLLSYAIHEKVCAGSEKAYETLVQYLHTFEAEGDASSAKEQAGTAIALAISLDTVHEYNDLLGLKVVQQLSKDGDKLAALLAVFASGELKQYQSSLTADEAVLKEKGLTKDSGLKKIQMTCFTALANKNSELSFADISNALNIGEDQVEEWIVAAVAANLLEARIDQLARKAFVQWCPQQAFTQDQWQSMQTQIGVWKDSVKRMLTSLEEADATN